ncbi:condensation domain-containing protein [Chryseobacterium indologenes]|nr:condensation domain-containing protein [Chryseobacterium indologenes]
MMKRRLMMAERIMYVDPETPVNCIFTAKINGRIAEGNFATALAKIQQKHPLLRMRIDYKTEVYPIYTEEKEMEPIPIRIVERHTDDDWMKESEKEWFRLFNDEKKPLAQVVWVKGEDISEILWVMPHCIGDGGSLVTLMRELLELLDNPSSELQPYEVFSSADDFLPPDFDLKKKKRNARFYLLMAKLFFLMQRKSKIRNLGKNYVIHWKMNAEATSQITKMCKSQGISIHSLLCASFMQAFQEKQGSKAKGKVISPVDVRHFIPEIKQDHVFAFAPTVELSIKKGSRDVMQNAKRIKEQLALKIEKTQARELLWMGEQMHPIVERMISLLKSGRGGHDVTLSNMGKLNIPADYNHFKVETIYSPTVAFPWLNSTTLVTTTFNQKMDFMFISHEDFLPKAEATAIKDKALEFLMQPV